MTDPTTAPAKPIWTRCKGRSGQSNGCGQRVFNDRIDIERHLQHCPADLERIVEKLEKRIEKLEKAEPVMPELPDLEDVADDWPTSSDELEPDEDPGLEGQEVDEDDEELTAPTTGSSLYTPVTLT